MVMLVGLSGYAEWRLYRRRTAGRPAKMRRGVARGNAANHQRLWNGFQNNVRASHPVNVVRRVVNRTSKPLYGKAGNGAKRMSNGRSNHTWR